jgi:hypothetical protein
VSTDLDAPGAIPRTQGHTDTLVNTGGIELQELWDDYGIVGDIIVSLALYCPNLTTHFRHILPAVYNDVSKGRHSRALGS